MYLLGLEVDLNLYQEGTVFHVDLNIAHLLPADQRMFDNANHSWPSSHTEVSLESLPLQDEPIVQDCEHKVMVV